MDKVQINDTYFTANGMVPEAGDDLTDLWGRKIISNLWNGYGLIGTCTVVERNETIISLRFGLKYQLPPEINLIVKDIDDTSLGWATVRDGNPDRKRIQYAFTPNGIVFFNGTDFFQKTQLVVFRLHGV